MIRFDDLIGRTALILRPKRNDVVYLYLTTKTYHVEPLRPRKHILAVSYAASHRITKIQYQQTTWSEGPGTLEGYAVENFRVQSETRYTTDGSEMYDSMRTESKVVVLSGASNIENHFPMDVVMPQLAEFL